MDRGLKAIKVASLNKVKISQKIASKLTTHNIVFGILNRLSMHTLPVKSCKIRHFLCIGPLSPAFNKIQETLL